MTKEEILSKAFSLIEQASRGKNIENDAKNLLEEYAFLSCKYKKGDFVWFFDGDYSFVRAEVVAVSFSGEMAFYRLCEESGRNCGNWREEQVFATKKELREHLMSICEKNAD